MRTPSSIRRSAIVRGAIFAAMIASTSCAHAPADADAARRAEKPRPTTADYRRFLRGSALTFDASRVDDWDSPDPNHVVVWTSPAEAYLLTLLGACFNLRTASTILLSSPRDSVRAGAGAVIVANERCPIQTVERLDARAIRKAGLH